MTSPDAPQSYLLIDSDSHLGALEQLVKSQQFDACLCLNSKANSEFLIAVRDLCQANEVAVLMEDDLDLVRRLFLDGLHLSDASQTKQARADLGEAYIVGAFAADRHAAMLAGEAGADYLMFVDPHNPDAVDQALISWWMEIMEPPCVGNQTHPGDFALIPLSSLKQS